MRRTLAIALVLLAGCKADHETHVPETKVPDAWSPGAGPATATEPPERWWSTFQDPELEALVERATKANLDLKLAQARILEARALRDFAAGARQPQLDAVAGYSRVQGSRNTFQGQSTNPRPQDLFTLGFDATWEIDLFGALGHELEAAQAGVEAAEEDRRAALVTLLGDVAREYVDLRGTQRLLAVTQGNADVQRQWLDLIRAQSAAGLATDLDIARAEALLASTTAQIPALESARAASVHRLALLLGETPGALDAELAETRPIPVPPDTLAVGLPADLVRRRPDVRSAERQIAQAAALSAEATSNLFPRLTLSGTFGVQSRSTGNLLDGASQTWSIGPSLLAPIFAGGRLRANVRAQDAREQQAVIRYEKTVLQALTEVEDALVAATRGRERVKSLESGLASSRRALDLAWQLHQRGLADYFQVLDAQRTQLSAESDLARGVTDLSSQTVALYKALGGGWESQPEPAEAKAAE
jgi:multidrug efflux system outer membrane protein